LAERGRCSRDHTLRILRSGHCNTSTVSGAGRGGSTPTEVTLAPMDRLCPRKLVRKGIWREDKVSGEGKGKVSDWENDDTPTRIHDTPHTLLSRGANQELRAVVLTVSVHLLPRLGSPGQRRNHNSSPHDLF
jgi:hypothetical protein